MIYTCTYFQETTSCANKHPHLIYNTDCDTISSFHDYEEQKKNKKTKHFSRYWRRQVFINLSRALEKIKRELSERREKLTDILPESYIGKQNVIR